MKNTELPDFRNIISLWGHDAQGLPGLIPVPENTVTVNQRTNVSGNVTIDANVDQAVSIIMIDDITINIIAPTDGAPRLKVLIIDLIQGTGAPHNVTWPLNVVSWAGNYPPAPDITPGATTTIQLHSMNNGATWKGGKLTQMGS